MIGYVVLLIVCAAGLVMSWLRYDAGRQRRATTARLAEEATTSTLSPTEELFRAEGVPIPEAMRDGLEHRWLTPHPPSSQDFPAGIRADTRRKLLHCGDILNHPPTVKPGK